MFLFFQGDLEEAQLELEQKDKVIDKVGGFFASSQIHINHVCAVQWFLSFSCAF